jgi:hypothetical protein
MVSLCLIQAAETAERSSPLVRPHPGNENLSSASGNRGQYVGFGFEETHDTAVSFEEHEFTTRFNRLLNALHDFAATYNTGHVVNVKKAKAIRKAWHELEKSDWFKAQAEGR